MGATKSRDAEGLPKVQKPLLEHAEEKVIIMAGKSNDKKNGTKTSSFGIGGRFNHDSSKFYSSKMYSGIDSSVMTGEKENTMDLHALDKIFCKSSEKMEELPDNSVHLMVTSPPYNVGKEYDQNLSLDEYRNLLKTVFEEVYRVLVVGGRACVNIANLGRKPYIPLHSFIIEDMIKIGFFMRGEIIWNKGSSASPSTAWGSWMSAKNPTLRDIHEYILVFSKGNNGRFNPDEKESTITKDEFMELTKSVWNFQAVQARSVGHPAPFPLELPTRLIKLYTFKGDIVLDPFMGSGMTAIAAKKIGRKYIGYDISKEYCELAEERIKKEFSQKTLKSAA